MPPKVIGRPQKKARGRATNFFSRYLTFNERSAVERKKKKVKLDDEEDLDLKERDKADVKQERAQVLEMWQRVSCHKLSMGEETKHDAAELGLKLVLPKPHEGAEKVMGKPALCSVSVPTVLKEFPEECGKLLGMAVTCSTSALHQFFACHAALASQPRVFLCFTEAGLNVQHFRHDRRGMTDAMLPTTHFEQYWHLRDEIYHIDPQLIAQHVTTRQTTMQGNDGISVKRKLWSHIVIAATEKMLLIDPRDEHDRPMTLTPLRILRHADADTVRLGAWTDAEWKEFADSRAAPVSTISVPVREFGSEIFHKIRNDRSGRVFITKTKSHLNFEIERGNTRIPLTYERFEPVIDRSTAPPPPPLNGEEKKDVPLKYVVNARDLSMAAHLALVCHRMLIKFPPSGSKAPLLLAAEMEPKGMWCGETFFEMYVPQE